MTEPDDTAEKNEQELNLFSTGQGQPSGPDESEASAAAEQPAEDVRPDMGQGFDENAASDRFGTDETVDAAPPPSDVMDSSGVVAPPPPQRRPVAPPPRPGIVPPSRNTFSASSRARQVPGSAVPAHKPLPHPIQQEQSLGQTLASIRAGRSLSLEEVAAATRIRQEYLVDLEADKLLSRLPPVYISAYVRKLIDVYDLSGPDAESLIEKMHGETPQDPEALPEKLIESVNDGALVNEGENKRIRNITIIFFSVVAVIAAAIIWLVVLVLVRHFGKSEPPIGRTPSEVVSGSVQPAEAPVPQEILLDESELDALIVPETPSISVLKMDKTPGIRDTP